MFIAFIILLLVNLCTLLLAWLGWRRLCPSAAQPPVNLCPGKPGRTSANPLAKAGAPLQKKASMNNLAPRSPALVALVTSLVPAMAAAAGRTYWVGKGPSGDRYLFTNTNGKRWTGELRSEGKTLAKPFKEVRRTEDFIEFQPVVGKKGLRARLYKDKFTTRSPRVKWTEMARGKWVA